MTGGSQRAALDAVHSARPIVARLSTSADKEDLAADIIESWTAVETGLRSLLGGSALTGPALIRELRQRQFLSLDQANALAEFHAARERAGSTDYAPTEADINATRAAFLKLESGLMGAPESGMSAPSRNPAADDTAAAVIPGVGTPPASTLTGGPGMRRSNGPPVLYLIIGAVVLLGIIGGGWYMFAGRGGSSASYQQGVAAYSEGRREAAEGAFHKAALDAPGDPMPHVYLSRMERERGNLNNANTEAVKAVELGPASAPALRELASVLFAQQNFDGARTFYTRAVKADSSDRLAQGFLGCSLVRLGRVPEGQRWLDRAGTGAWSACVPPAGAPGPVTRGP
ncbi:MAG: hypothetical protein ABJE47_04230 [bacterium]